MSAMPTDDRSGREELAKLSAFGPFFEVRRTTPPGSWHSLRELLAGPVLGQRVAHVHASLTRLAGTEVEPRVAASTLSLGLFARLVSPVLGAATLGITLPRPSLDDIRWQPAEAGPWPLALVGSPSDPEPAAMVADVVAPLVAVLADGFSLSEQILWGNAASAVFGAVTMIGVARPDLRPRASAIGTELLAGPLAGTGELRGAFVRSSCCLYYRVPGGGYCGDCVLVHR
jgi:FhuF 2Fe-2S C-terminal domain